MFSLTEEQSSLARSAILTASAREDVHAAVTQIYRDLQTQIDARRPQCIMSGRCCRFEEFGHRLYVTTLELAKFLHDLQQLNLAPAQENPGGCPFQKNNLCSVHQIRPFACRLFFCDSTATDWQHEQYQLFHNRLRQLHDELAVPYFYLEWRQAPALILPSSHAAPTQP